MSNLVNGTVCLMLHFRRPGIKRRLKDEQFEAMDADKDLVGASKKIVEAAEYGHVASFEASIKGWLRSVALPSKLYRSSTYLIPTARIAEVDDYLEQARKTWQEKVDSYVAVYPERKAETMRRLGATADESDYLPPEQVRAAFGFEHEYVTLSTPTSLKQISAQLFEREQERLRLRLQSAEDQIKMAFRAQFAELVAAMKKMLEPDVKNAAGRAMKFSPARIERLQQFMSEFKVKNICGDVELAAMMGQLDQMLQGVDPKELKDDKEWRLAMAAHFASVEQQLGALVTTKPKRAIDVDDEDAA